MKRQISYTLHLCAAVTMLAVHSVSVLGADEPKGKKSKKDAPADAAGEKLIDLLTADPKDVDLAKIDPARLDLTKESVKRIDLEKWDLSLIDTSKVKDPLAAKWIIKVVRSKESREKTLDRYGPGELEKLQEQNLQWLRRPAPFNEPELTRSHRHSVEQIERGARMIDEVLRAKLGESKLDLNPPASDEQFLRRVYLDIAGRIPTAQEAQVFLADGSATKRRELIDRLLLSADYPSQMFNWLADMLRVKELKSNQGETSSYQAWLMDQVTANRPWNQTVHDMLTAEGDLVTNPAVGWLVRDSGMPLDSLANTLTIFMGASVGCAQCHDHPFNDYTQRSFYEMAAFFGSTEIPGRNVRAEPKVMKNHHHRVVDAPGEFLTLPDDYQYDDAKPGSRVMPAFAMLQQLAPRKSGTAGEPLGRKDFALWMTGKKNEQFAATMANRLWGKAFGRAVMEPVTEMDDLDDKTKGHDPRLIHLIAGFMQSLDFDLMAFQRVIYNTRAYQSRASVTPEVGTPYHFPGPLVRRMTAGQAWDSFATLIKGEAVNDVHRDRRSLMWSYDVFKEGAIDAIIAASGKGMEKDKDKEKDKKKGGDDRKIEFELLIKKAGEMSADLLRELHESEGSGKKSRKNDDNEGDAMARASERAQPEADDHFMRQFGQSERELADAGSNEGSVPQTLMLMNGHEHEMLAAPTSHLMQVVDKARGEAERTDLMYLSFLARRPNVKERGLISQERIGPEELVWMLMNSREFIFVQ